MKKILYGLIFCHWVIWILFVYWYLPAVGREFAYRYEIPIYLRSPW